MPSTIVRRRRPAWIAATLVASLAWPASGAPLVEQLFVEKAPLAGAEQIPGFDPTRDVVRNNGQRGISLAPNGNFVGAVNTDPFQGNAGFAGTFYHFGSSDRGANPRALRREALLAGYQQESFIATAIDNAGDVLYTATLVNPSAPPTRLSSLWHDDQLVLLQGDAFPRGPLEGRYAASASAPFLTPDGGASWISNYADAALGPIVGSALLRDLQNMDVLLQSGDPIGDLGFVAFESGAISSNIRRSDLGTHYLTSVDLELGFTSTDEVMVVNGQPIATRSGALVREGSLIPAADGGLPNEAWQAFNAYDINEAGDVALAAFTTADENDAVLMVNGSIVHRQNDVVDGVTLSGQVQGVALNDLGSLAYLWNDTLFVDGRAVAGIGTLVDTDDDGAGDAPLTNVFITLFDMTNLPAAGGDGLPVVYFAGDVDGLTSIMRLRPAPLLDGDYNGDGAVDAADYTVWRDALGSSLLLAADGNRNNVVDQADRDVWKAGYGAAAGSAEAASPVPEPTAWLAGCWAGAGARPPRRRQRITHSHRTIIS